LRELEEEAGVTGGLGPQLGTIIDNKKRTRTSFYAVEVTHVFSQWQEGTSTGKGSMHHRESSRDQADSTDVPEKATGRERKWVGVLEVFAQLKCKPNNQAMFRAFAEHEPSLQELLKASRLGWKHAV
jgi:ADP-ribose pyrophosphatase YjhB (NUDIX family)